MKRSEGYDFTQPTRQSYAAILLITYRLYKILARQLFPLVLIVLLQGKLDKSTWLIYPVIIIAVLGAIYSIFAFFKYFFYIQGDKLVVEKGVFKRSVLEIPFDRIQSINFEQNLIHRLFSVVKLNMDTAGSSGNELQLNALSRGLASQLSSHILSSRKKPVNQEINNEIKDEERSLIFRLNILQLLKVGITENHIRSGGVIVFFLFYIWENLQDIGIDLIERGEEYVPAAQEILQSFAVVIILVILFSFVAFAISLVRTVLNYYDLRMFRKGHGFVVVAGLLNKKERAAKDEKVQILKSSQNLLQSWSGIFELVFRQASSAQQSESRSIKVVGLSAKQLEQAQKYVFRSSYSEARSLEMIRVDFYYLYRRLFYWSLLYLVIAVLSLYFNQLENLVYSTVLYAFAVFASVLAWRKKQFAFGNNVLRLDGGIFGYKRQLLENHKIQSIRLKETPFQRRRGLASIDVYTASGSLFIPDIPKNRALNMKNYLLYKVESTRRRWM